jgi:hypothetical protein
VGKEVLLAAALVAAASPTSKAWAGELRKELARPEKYPAYIYKKPGDARSRVARFQLDGKTPSGPIQCEHIRVHDGKNDEVMAWESRSTAASNVYYHVHRAIDYFNALSVAAGETIYREKKPIDVRINMGVDWAMWIRFAAQERYNASQTFPDIDPDRWGTDDEDREVWFFIPKRMYMPWFLVTRWVPGMKDTVLGTAGFPLDSARVPTIIYHEWTHLMTRPYLGLMHDTPLNEGYSNYFGSVIGGSPHMGDTEEFSTWPYKHDYSGKPSPTTDKDYQVPTDFVPSLLWSLRFRYGGKRADVFIWRALNYLKPESRLEDLPDALLKSAEGVLSAKELEGMRASFRKLFIPPGGRAGS